MGIVLFVLLAAYIVRIVGVASDKPAPGSRPSRSKVRETTDAIAMPLTALTSKHKRGYDLSALRCVVVTLLALVWKVLTAGGHFTADDVKVVAIVALTIPVADLFAAVPVREGLAAFKAIATAGIRRYTGGVEQATEAATAIVTGTAVPPLATDVPEAG